MELYDQDKQQLLAFMDFKNLHTFVTQCKACFVARDTDGSGRLEGNEVRAALASAGYRLSEPSLQTLLKHFDKERAGGLRFDDYVDLSIALSRMRDAFAHYDASCTGSVVFDCNTFCAAAWSVI
jgi:Ca2+-binding EF-hand superfamily protein